MSRVYEADYRELTPDKRNANRGTKRGRDLHQKSLERLGAGRSVLVDKDGNIIAGNKTVEVAQDLGIPLKVVETYGDELVVVKRMDMDLTDDHGSARELAYADNRVGQVNLDFAEEIIAADREAGVGALDEFWFPDEIAELVEGYVAGRTDGDEGEVALEEAPQPRASYAFSPGDVIGLGVHFLTVGNGNLDEVAKLIHEWETYTGFTARIAS